MTRHVLIRDKTGERIAEEAELLTEEKLHDVLTTHPELVPAEDLGIGRVAVAGRESGLESGYADLVLIDRAAQVCLVEVKKEGNPDTRRVVAQLLDYASAPWEMSVEDFERGVLHPYLRSTGASEAELPDIASYAAQQLASGQSDGEAPTDEFDDFARQLEQTLATGQFRLVVAAPSIPPGVQRVIEYMNARGMLLYGLEISYFGGATECFVPRIVVKPSVADTQKVGGAASPIDEEDFVQGLPEDVRERAAAYVRASAAAGAKVKWTSFGPGIRARRHPERQIWFLERKRIGIHIKAPEKYPEKPFVEASVATNRFGGREDQQRWLYLECAVRRTHGRAALSRA